MNHDPSRTQRLIKRLRYLWTFELFDSFFLPAVVIFSARRLQQPMALFTMVSVGLVTWLLWQGAAYWWLKLQATRTDSDIPERALRWFAVFKKVNWALIGLLPLLLLVRGLLDNAFSSPFDAIAGLAMVALAVLEQINYYHVQLMVDYPPDWRCLLETKRLKRSSLRRALEGMERDSKVRSGEVTAGQ